MASKIKGAAPGFQVVIGGQYDELMKYLNGLSRGALKRITKAQAYRLSLRVASMVRDGYRNADYVRRPATRHRYVFGGPGARTWPNADPMFRSGTLAKSVVVRRATDNPNGPGYRVMIDPTRTYGGAGDPQDASKLVARIAAQLEDPKPVIIRVTRKLLRYLHWLAAKSGQPMPPPKHTHGKYIIYTPKAKPVWAAVRKEINKLKGPNSRSLMKRLQLYRTNPAMAMSAKVDL